MSVGDCGCEYQKTTSGVIFLSPSLVFEIRLLISMELTKEARLGGQ